MCGRFSLTKTEKQLLLERFNVDECPKIEPRYNIAPGQDVLAILDNDHNNIVKIRWGYTLHWSKDDKLRTINTRAETIDQKPMYKESFEKRRCLIIADSFYEWKNIGGKKIPYRFIIGDEDLFCFAGIWDEWNGTIGCSIITTEPNSIVKKVHERMPVILNKKDESSWLNKALIELLKPFSGKIESYQISTDINNPENEGKEIIEKVKGLSTFFS